MKFWNGMGASIAAIAFSLAAGAQTTAAPATCTTAPTAITAFNIERTVALNNVLTTLTPNAPANVLASIQAGAQEVREQIVYNPQLGTVTSTVFLVAPGSPTPTPANTAAQNAIQSTTIQVSQILSSCSPTPSLLLVGTITASPASGVFGSVNGAPAAVSVGYTTDNPAKINNVVVLVAGQLVAYSSGAAGTLTFRSTPVTPPGSTGAVTVKVKFAGGTIAQPNTATQTPISPLLIDATGSTGTGALTYAFTSLAGHSPLSVVQTGTPGIVYIQFPAPGDYSLVVTVTDSTGATGSQQFLFTYTGRPQ